MDMSRVHHVKSQNMKRDSRKTMSNKKPVKVVYVATPVKVNISASNFRALVQQLTGRESDLSRFEDFNSFNAEDFNNFSSDCLEKSWEVEDDHNNHGEATISNNSLNYSDNGNNDDVTRPVISSYSVDYGNNENIMRPVIHEFQSAATMVEDHLYEYSPSSSESLLDSFDDVVSSQIVEELEQMFPSNLFGYESCMARENHVLGDVYGVV